MRSGLVACLVVVLFAIVGCSSHPMTPNEALAASLRAEPTTIHIVATRPTTTGTVVLYRNARGTLAVEVLKQQGRRGWISEGGVVSVLRPVGDVLTVGGGGIRTTTASLAWVFGAVLDVRAKRVTVESLERFPEEATIEGDSFLLVIEGTASIHLTRVAVYDAAGRLLADEHYSSDPPQP